MSNSVSVLTLERLKKDWSSAELARRSGLYTSAIRNIECYRHQPNDRTLYRIAEALGVDFEYLRAAILDEFITRRPDQLAGQISTRAAGPITSTSTST